MSRLLILVYGVVSYAIGMGGLVFFILFLGGWEFFPYRIDATEPGSLAPALLINTGLILLWGLQHSVMARQGFKKAWTKLVPEAAERSTYVLLSGVVLVLISLFWQPIAGRLWHIESPNVRAIVTAIELLGWGLVVLSTFVINHFELFGLQRVYYHFASKPAPEPDFTERFLYNTVRHPLQLGVLIGIWFAPTMSMSHLMMSIAMTIYIFIGIHFEEKDLLARFGSEYEDYRRRVRMIIPIPMRTRSIAP